MISQWKKIKNSAHVTPVYKKGNVTDKENYRPISGLSNFSKISEKLIYNQIFKFMIH